MAEKIIQAVWQGVVLASSTDTVELEGHYYFPAASVDMQYLQPSLSHTHCPRKGEASYYHVTVAGVRIADAAWFYPHPLPEAAAIEGRLAFWRGINVYER